MPRPPRMWAVVGEYDQRLGRVRTHSDDFFDHRKVVLDRINRSLANQRRR